MTEALRKMVEAMAAELKEQATEFGRSFTPITREGGAPTAFTGLYGEFDLEKVARAGLASISEVDAAIMSTAAHLLVPPHVTNLSVEPVLSESADITFRAIIQAIAGESR